MSARVIVAEMKQETATFNPALTRYEDFRIVRGQRLLDTYRGTRTEVSGAIDALEASGCEILPGLAAAAVSGGPIATPDLDRLLEELVTSVEDQAERADAICLCFHGAMAGQEEGDPEGRALREIRQVAPDLPLVVSLDLHAVLTDQMIAHADVLVPYHTYPHTDHYETGQRAARVLLQLLSGTARPAVFRLPLPMLVRGDELLTATGKFGEAIRMCQEVERSAEGLAAGVLIGNAFTDVPALQSNVLVTTNQDPAAARGHAERIGRFMWEHRALFQADLTPLDEALRIAAARPGLTVFSDAADATASGAAGDSNAILKGLVASRFAKRALVPLVDAPAVQRAFEAGVGGEIETPLGGTRDPTRFTPLTLKVRVKSLHDGEFRYEDGTLGRAGGAAVLVAGNLELLVTRRPVYVVGLRVFRAHGLDPVDYDLVVVKSPNGFRTWYESLAATIVPVDVPGSTSANLRSLPFQRCVRPIFPLDDLIPDPFAEAAP